MDFFSIIKEALSVGISIDANNKEHQKAVLERLYKMDAELKSCIQLIFQEKSRLVRRVKTLAQDADAGSMIQSLEEVFSARTSEIELLVSQVNFCIDKAKASKYQNYDQLEPMLSSWSSDVSTAKEYIFGIVRQFDQVIDDARG